MSCRFDLSGLYVPVVTTFELNGKLDLEHYAENIRAFNEYEFRGR